MRAIVISRKWLKCLKSFTMWNNDVGMVFLLENNQWDTDSYLVLCSIYKESADPLCSARVHVWDFAEFSTHRKRLDLSVQENVLTRTQHIAQLCTALRKIIQVRFGETIYSISASTQSLKV